MLFWGGPKRGSVGVVRGPVRKPVRGPGFSVFGSPDLFCAQCFRVTRIYLFIFFALSPKNRSLLMSDDRLQKYASATSS